MNKKLTTVSTFFLAIGAVVVTLLVLNWLPLVLQKETLRQYGSIDEVRKTLNRKDIKVPAYFPQQITWPPLTILAQSKPHFAIITNFTRANKRDIALVISQSEGPTMNIEDPIRITTIKEKVRYTLQGKETMLTVGTCKNDEPCSGLTWTEENQTITVLLKSNPFELIRMAESMIH